MMAVFTLRKPGGILFVGLFSLAFQAWLCQLSLIDGCAGSETRECDHLDLQWSTNALFRGTIQKGMSYLLGYSCFRTLTGKTKNHQHLQKKWRNTCKRLPHQEQTENNDRLELFNGIQASCDGRRENWRQWQLKATQQCNSENSLW